MQHALERAREENNESGETLLLERIPPVIEVPPDPTVYIREDIHQKMTHIFSQQFRNRPLLVGPSGVGKTTIANSYPGEIPVFDHLDEWESRRLGAALESQEEGQPFIGCCRRLGKHEDLLRRVFTIIHVEQPDKETTLEILRCAFPAAEESHFEVVISETRDPLPGGAIHLYDEAIDKEAVSAYARERYGIPSFSEEKINGLEEFISKRIKGQNEAIEKILPPLKSFARGRGTHRGLHFPGLTGTGKTEMAYVIAEWLYGSRDKVFHVNMGNYTEAHSLWALLGTPPGLVGYEQGGRILEMAKQGPFLLLLDDIHHSNEDCVAGVIHELCDKGKLFDPLTQQDIDCSHVFVILTSNLGASTILEEMKGGTEYFIFRKKKLDVSNYNLIETHTKASESKFFSTRPETLNRFRSIPLLPITDEDTIDSITEKFLEEEKLQHECNVEWTQDFVEWCSDTYGKDPQEGMRGIRYYIQNTLRNTLCEMGEASILLEDKGAVTIIED